MPATTVRTTPRPDARIPVFTLAPQVVATLGAWAAAAWSSLAIGVVLYLVPGRWSRVGALFARRVSHGVPPRHAAMYVSRRLVGIALPGSAITFVTVPILSTVSAALALVALVVWCTLEDR